MTVTQKIRPFFSSQSAVFSRSGLSGEPDLSELWNDPVLLAVLSRDGLSVASVQQQMEAARRRLCPAVIIRRPLQKQNAAGTAIRAA